MVRMQTSVCVRTPLFHVVDLGIAAVVHSVLGQVCLIIVRGLHWYSMFSSTRTTVTATAVQ